MDIDKALQSTEESYTYPFNPVFFFHVIIFLLKYFLNTRDIFLFPSLLLKADKFFVELTNKKLSLPL